MVSRDDLTPYQGTPLPTRRTFLNALLGTGAAVVLGGAASQVTVDPVDARSPATDTWPQPDYDAAGSAFEPEGSPPTDPSVDWTAPAPDGGVAGRELVVGPEAVYANGANFAALDRADGSERWRVEETAGRLALGDGRLYAGLEPFGTLRALSPAGERVWQHTPEPDRERVLGLVPTADGLLVARTNGVSARDPADGTQLWWTGRAQGYPAVAGGRLYLAGGDVWGLGGRSLLDLLLGSGPGVDWTSYRRPAGLVGTDRGPVVGGRAAGEDALVAYDEAGEVRWTGAGGDGLPGEFIATPEAVTDGRCLASLTTRSGPHAVGSYRLANGGRTWRETLDHEVHDIAVVRGTALLATGADGDGGTVRALDLADGRERWRVPAPEPVASLAPVDRTVFALTEDRSVVAVR